MLVSALLDESKDLVPDRFICKRILYDFLVAELDTHRVHQDLFLLLILLLDLIDLALQMLQLGLMGKLADLRILILFLGHVLVLVHLFLQSNHFGILFLQAQVQFGILVLLELQCTLELVDFAAQGEILCFVTRVKRRRL